MSVGPRQAAAARAGKPARARSGSSLAETSSTALRGASTPASFAGRVCGVPQAWPAAIAMIAKYLVALRMTVPYASWVRRCNKKLRTVRIRPVAEA
jgi:hypothetical protein